MERETKKQEIAALHHLKRVLERIGIEATIEEGAIGDSVAFMVHTREAGLLIGEDGQNLLALNYIVRRIVEKETGRISRPFLVDVNDYQRKRFDELRDTARMSAQRVRYFKKEVALIPMSSFDRRIVHLTLQEYPDIITESVGEGGGRRVVIRPYMDD